MTSELELLIAQLDSPHGGEPEDAQAALTALGTTVMPTLLSALPGMGRMGKLCSIEIIEELEYKSSGPSLVALLRDDHDTVRDWAAGALGRLGYEPAIPELLALRSRLLVDQVPMDWTEQVSVRAALTALGQRRAVVPAALEATVERRPTGPVWPAAQLEDLLTALAAAGQVVLYFQVWRRHERFDLIGESHAASGWQFQRSDRWTENVQQSHEAALLEASDLPTDRHDLVVSIEWIDAGDVAASLGS